MQQNSATHGDVEAQLLLPPQPLSEPVSTPLTATMSRRSTTSDFDERLCVICYDRLACTVRANAVPLRRRAYLSAEFGLTLRPRTMCLADLRASVCRNWHYVPDLSGVSAVLRDQLLCGKDPK